MPRIIFVISGRVISHQTQRGVGGLQVEVWHLAGRWRTQHKLIGASVTNDQGSFSVAATDEHFDKFSIPPKPNVFFRVYRQGQLLKSTEKEVLMEVTSGRTGILIEIDLADDSNQEFTVAGRVIARSNPRRSTANLRIEARHKDQQGVCDKLIGSTMTGEQGEFLIRATAEYLAKHSIPDTPDIYFKIYDQERLIKSTENDVLYGVKTGRTDILIELDIPTPPHFDEPQLAVELGLRLTGTAANGAALTQDQIAPLNKVIWVEDGNEVLVHLDSVQVRILDRTLLVSIDLETDQTGRQPLVVVFALGGAEDQAGLIAVTDELPHGNPQLAARWGRALQAAVWSSLLGLVNDHASDQRLAPLGISAEQGRLRLHVGSQFKSQF